MSWWEAIVLGLLQGLTEFLPVSSSAHLRIAGPLLPSGGDPGAAFTAITQLGTELAVLIYFRHDIWRILQDWVASVMSLGRHHTEHSRMGWLIIVGTIPIAVLGLLFKDAIETTLRNLYLTAFMLIAFALVLAWADRVGKKKRELSGLTWRSGLLFGFAQALALIPGVSRSGGTITAGLLMGFSRHAAARYSFLLAIPAVLASGGYQLYKTWGQPSVVSMEMTALATVVSFFSGYLVIIWFLKMVSTRTYMPFVVYRIALGVLVLVLLGLGILSPY
ncbi:MAG: undecaprenyl-diphosphate phosphatase [Aquabacterium sp.]